jgi:translocation and assembly module TamB
MTATVTRAHVLIRWLKRIVLALAVLLALILAFGVWLFNTEAGARFALRFAPSELKVAAISGTLADTFNVSNLSFKVAGTEITLVSGKVNLRWRQLLSKNLDLDELKLDGLRVILTKTPGAPAAATGPSSNPVLLLRNLNLRNVRIERDGELLAQINSASADALSVVGEKITLNHLKLEEQRATINATGTLDYSGQNASDLTFSVLGHEPGFAASGSVRGTPKKMAVEVTLSAPQKLSFQGVILDGLSPQLSWQGSVKTTELNLEDLAVVGPVKLLDADLTGSGTRTAAKLSGTLKLDGDAFTLRAMDVDFADAQRLNMNALALGLPSGGTFDAAGSWPLDAIAPPGELTAHWTNFSLPERFAWPLGLSSTTGQLQIAGRTQEFVATLDLALSRAQLNQATLSGQISGKISRAQVGGLDQFSLAPLRLVNSDGGVLNATGQVSLAANISWALAVVADKLNPALIATDWPGSIGLNAQSSGTFADGKPSAEVQITALSGTLKGQNLSGLGTLRFAKSLTPTGDLAVRWGVNSADFSSKRVGDVQANVDIANLAAIAPDSSGSVQGSVTLRTVDAAQNRNRSAAFTLEGTLQARLLRIRGITADTVDITAALPSDLTAPIALKLAVVNCNVAGQHISTTAITLDGTRAAHRVNAKLDSDVGALELGAQGTLSDRQGAPLWRGVLREFKLLPTFIKGSATGGLALQAPVNLQLTADSAALDRACFDGIGAALCVALDWRKAGNSKLALELAKLDLAELSHAFGGVAPGVNIRGIIAGRADATLADGELRALNTALAPIAGSTLTAQIERSDADDVLLEFSQFDLSAISAAGAPPALNVNLVLNDAGSVRAQNLVLRGDKLGGELRFDLNSLKAFNGLSDAVINPAGTLKGNLALSGSRSEPQIIGTLNLTQLAMELPAAGLKISGGTLALNSDGSRLNVAGEIVSKASAVLSNSPSTTTGAINPQDGTLKISGWFAPFATAKTELKFDGKNVLIVDIPSARVVASPNLQIAHDGSQIKISGALELPSAKLALDRFESNVSRSDDVNVIDDTKPAPGTPIHADVTVTLGDDVALKGFGLNGKLSGRLKIRERANKPATARGEIEVKGTFKAYGQDLLIERGKLLFSATPLDDPGLDIRAVRKIEALKAGVQVRGTALRPELTVWSDPVLEQSDVLSYIVLGRSLKGASGADSALVGQAANALGTAGGNLLARGLGQKVGLELGVETLSDIGGPAFTAGKYLSPALYVGYGKGLFNPQTLFIVRYKLFERYELEGLSGREQKVGVNYRLER